MFKGCAILPAAQVLFDKTKVALKDIPEQWSNGTVVVCKKPNGKLHFIAGASGSYSEIGELQQCYHDQTGAQFAGPWEVVNEVRYKKNDDGSMDWTPKIPFDAKFNISTKAALAVFK